MLTDVQLNKANELIKANGWNIPHNDTFIDFSKVTPIISHVSEFGIMVFVTD